MKTVTLDRYMRSLKERKATVGFDESAAAVETRRNKGGRRTVTKRAALRRAAERAEAAGVEPVVGY